ncbi:uracil-DNA glycosylase [Pseudopelagicola sp. nBUS_20]|uniref:uracil-DNA glycosylase n=1 Tax=Pseudopelagicola sp. nBUS_20 TaxID=3395317 RepID=UPI003EBD644E
MDLAIDHHTARVLLEWQVELGATEAVLDAPLNRYEAPEKQVQDKALSKAQPATLVLAPEVDAVQVARQVARGAKDLVGLRAALETFNHCELKLGAKKLVFGDGNPEGRVMIIGEAPGRDEDSQGRPFVGRAGQLLDRMLGSINMGRSTQLSKDSVYITNVLPWRPPQNRDPKPEEIAMLTPFLERHVEIVAPDVLVLMGNISCQAVLGRRGISRLRGHWFEALGSPVLPMFHPAFLLRRPAAKREAWADLLSLKAKLETAV